VLVRVGGRPAPGTGAEHRPVTDSGVRGRPVCCAAITYLFITADVLLPFSGQAGRFISGQ
jgi:hypothetical protein